MTWLRVVRGLLWAGVILQGSVAVVNGIALLTDSVGFDGEDFYRPAFWAAYNGLMLTTLFREAA